MENRANITPRDEELMREAIRLSRESIAKGGGPFGAVIARDGEVIAATSNSVVPDNDPTAHAEVNCIREACRKLNTFDLSDCVIYTSCEPCPMCLGAIYWAHIGKIYYANTRQDANEIAFADNFIYDEIELPLEQRTKPIIPLLRDEAIKVFEEWRNNTDKVEY